MNASQMPSQTSETSIVAQPDLPPTEPTSVQLTPPTSKSLTPPTPPLTNENSTKPDAIAKGRQRGHSRQSLSVFERSAGSRQQIAEAIAACKLNPQQETLVALLLDPSRLGDSLATLADHAGVTAAEVLDLFRRGAIAEAHSIATSQLANGLPKVTEAVIAGAQIREVKCKCIREGYPDKNCHRCLGTGTVTKDANVENQKMVWQAGGLLKQGSGVNVNQSMNVGVAVGGSFLDRFVKQTDQIAYDVTPADVKEGEVA